MLSGRDPGELGIYGFRNRKDHSYNDLSIATSLDVKVPRVWDYLTRPGDHSIVLGVPGTWPPPAIRGDLVSGFLAPMSDGSSSDIDIRWTYPPELAREIEAVTPGYQVDVRDFRTVDRDRLITGITDMTRKHFTFFRHLLNTRPWNFAVMVEIGLDRIHHGFWRHLDPGHRLHEPDSPYKEVIRDYYRLLDMEIGETLGEIGFDVCPADKPGIVDPEQSETTVFIVSDHGARSLEGGFALNDWLIREGYLILNDEVVPDLDSASESAAERLPLTLNMIDWSKTAAWGEGGYYGRIFLNVAGREPEGIISPDRIDQLLSELTWKLESLPDDRGEPMGTIVRRPEELYSGINGIAPDLFVYFGDLAWRSIGTIGGDSLYTPGNDTGPDDANHAWDGIFIAAGRGIPDPRGSEGVDQATAGNILEVAPLVLSSLDPPDPA